MADQYHRGLRIVTGRTAQLPGDPKPRPSGAREPCALGRPTRDLCPLPEQEADPAPGGLWTITVPGTPMGKPRMTQRDKWKKRPCVTRYREWADAVRAAAREVPPAEQVVRLSWIATFEPPSSWSKQDRLDAIGTLHRQKPDRDNLDKAVLDILYPAGDQAIAAGTIEKRWGWVPSLEIRIEVTP